MFAFYIILMTDRPARVAVWRLCRLTNNDRIGPGATAVIAAHTNAHYTNIMNQLQFGRSRIFALFFFLSLFKPLFTHIFYFSF